MCILIMARTVPSTLTLYPQPLFPDSFPLSAWIRPRPIWRRICPPSLTLLTLLLRQSKCAHEARDLSYSVLLRLIACACAFTSNFKLSGSAQQA